MRDVRASQYDTYWVREDVIELADQGDCEHCRNVMLNPDLFPPGDGIAEPLEYADDGLPFAHKRCAADAVPRVQDGWPAGDPMDLGYLGTATSATADVVELERLTR